MCSFLQAISKASFILSHFGLRTFLNVCFNEQIHQTKKELTKNYRINKWKTERRLFPYIFIISHIFLYLYSIHVYFSTQSFDIYRSYVSKRKGGRGEFTSFIRYFGNKQDNRSHYKHTHTFELHYTHTHTRARASHHAHVKGLNTSNPFWTITHTCNLLTKVDAHKHPSPHKN